MTVNFTKMHGLGNDYIYFDCIREPEMIQDPENLARKLSNRHFSIGGDGIVLILNHDQADFQMRMFNSDGSEAEMCGNAIRCVGKYVYDNGYTDQEKITIQTGAGILTLELTVENNQVVKARVDMGEPVLNGLDIPVNIDKKNVIGEKITLASGLEYNMTCVSMGNPHAVIFVDEITDEHVLVHGRELEVNPLFPKRINVEFVNVISNDEIQMRVWERGAGETLACGTGASASAVASVLNNKTERNVRVHLLGGDLEIEWLENNHVYMTGPAEVSFTGTVNMS